MSSVVGIDIAKQTFDVATRQCNDKYSTRAKLANDVNGFEALRARLAKYAESKAWIVREATEPYH